MDDYSFDFDLEDLYQKLECVVVPVLALPNYEIQETTPNTAHNSRKKFPDILHEILQNQSDDIVSSIISWLPGGAGFIINNKRDFEDVILLTYFNGIKFRSFQRQLNIYGFERLEKGYHDTYAYRHNFFVQDQANLINYMKRVPVKKTS